MMNPTEFAAALTGSCGVASDKITKLVAEVLTHEATVGALAFVLDRFPVVPSDAQCILSFFGAVL